MPVVSRLTSSGDHYVTGEYDEYTLDNSNYGVAFNGTSQYLSAPSNAAFTFGTGDFTIEMWVYPTTNQPAFCRYFGTGSSTGDVSFDQQTLGLTPSFNDNATVFITSSIALTLNAWNHLAVTRSGTSLKMFVNGVVSGTATNSTNFTCTGTAIIGKNPGSATYNKGYFSNVRILKGTALYTAAFTPSTSPLTNIAGTSLLTCQNSTISDNSTNAFTITNNGAATTDKVQTTFYKTKFSGASQYLRVPYSAAFDFSQSNWTLECWFKANAFDLVILSKDTYGTNFDFCMYVSATTIFSQTAGTAQSYSVTTGLTLTTGKWYHLAMVRSAGTLNYYLDGVKYGAGSGMGITNVSNSYVTLGCFSWNNPSGFLNGSVSNLRMVQGTALYTSNFTPPTQQLTAISGTTFLTYQSPTIIDNSTNAITITNFNGVTVENPLSWNTVKRELFDGKFQTFRDIDEYTIPNSVYATQFNGSSQYLLLADNAAFQFGTGDFTIEAWVYLTTVNSTQRRSYGYQATGSTVCWVGVSTTNKFSAELRGVGAVNGVQVYSTTTPLINTWYHLAFARSGTTTYLFVNGVLETTTTGMNQNIASGGTPSIGAYNIGGALGDYWPGSISNVRVLKGTALYTAAFTPPTSPLTAITGTSLLTCQNSTIIDNSSNAFTVTNNGTATTTNILSTFYSGLFNGSSQYLTGGGGSTSLYLDGDFTIEFWINGSGGGFYRYMFSKLAAYTATNNVSLAFRNGNSTNISIFRGSAGGGGVIFNGGPGVTDGVWYHIAVVRSIASSLYKVFINGVGYNWTINDTGVFDYSTFTIMGNPNDGGSSLAQTATGGYLSNLRVVKGTALYTTNFTPPTQQLTAVPGTSLLTLQSPTIIDNSTNALSLTNVGTVTIKSPASFVQTKSKLFSNGTFQVSGSFNEVVIPIEYLAVAGGGGGGTGWGGGGGAGGMIVSTANLVASSVYTIIVGAGGGTISSGASREVFVSGSNTTITGTDVSIVAYGGGYGGVTSTAGSNGGSGGGGSGTNNGVGGSAAGKGVYPGSVYISATRQGYDGTTNGSAGGGGGGAGGAGSGSNGGPGLASTLSITGASVTYAGGGGGYNTGSGGSGGGGGVATSGTANLGGGGGADNGTTVGLGGSGVVVIRYPNTYPDPISLTGSPIANNTGGYKIYKFNSSGTIAF